MNSRVCNKKTTEHYLQFVAAYKYKNTLIGLCHTKHKTGSQ